MKYTIGITPEKMVKKFIDDDGKEYVNTWVVKGPGKTGTLEPAMDDQMEETGKFDEELLDAIYEENIDDIWEAIRD
ncbi:hypothetical protein [Clostridium scatologenes]|uniref:Uncharacterized protein n=1 Tax=Clostridium scatologenes TaxID=1548 RepID=A0A0E3JZP7_CLOSL|nr:hypothetical protein [Clostridium scatologenes]AKA68520.1 hypothetical protein CSCA_1395 [Clostridium scatologenes]